MNLKETYNKIAQDWHRDHKPDDWWIEGTDKLASFLKRGASVLDVGCGAGTKARYLLAKGFKVTGVDFSEKMIELAKREAPGASFSVKNIREPLDLEETFDAVFAQAVLLHVEKKQILDVMKNIAVPLKVGGYLYIAVKERKTGMAEEELVKERDYGYEYERFFSYYDLDELKKYFKQMGMEIVYQTITSSGKTNWLQVIVRKC